jgi:hypothetical protein
MQEYVPDSDSCTRRWINHCSSQLGHRNSRRRNSAFIRCIGINHLFTTEKHLTDLFHEPFALAVLEQDSVSRKQDALSSIAGDRLVEGGQRVIAKSLTPGEPRKS